MSDQLERILRPIVEGQIRSFVNDHPEVVAAVQWFKPRSDKGQTLVNSISKRILRDLLCVETRVRLMAALVEIPAASVVDGEPVTASGLPGGGVELATAPSLAAQAGEAGTAETVKLGSVHEHAVGAADAPRGSQRLP